MRTVAITAGITLTAAAAAFQSTHAQQQAVPAVVTTAPLFNYEDAPATPDADDPAIWVDRRQPRRTLVIGTLKDAGLVVYNLAGEMVQAIRPPNAPEIAESDPPTPAGLNRSANPCPESDSGATFGRFNNVDIAYDVTLGLHKRSPRADVAVVSDRGCDRLRFFKIDPSDLNGPLVDITAAGVERVFPVRYDQPSRLQPAEGLEKGFHANPLDDQNTAYGITVAQQFGGTDVFVTERERGLVKQLRIVPTSSGKLMYREVRTFLFDTSFALSDESGNRYEWTPCREAALEEPQAEGVEFDPASGTLFVGFETIGLYRIALRESLPQLVRVGGDRLIEPLISFGVGYHATPDDDEYECEYGPEGDPDPGMVVAEGSSANAGRFLQADLEGLSLVASDSRRTLLLASSQGDSSFHLYLVGRQATHVGEFLIEGVGETDGVDFVPTAIGRSYPLGLLVVQNGDAPEPDDTGDVNGFEFDGSTQFKFVSFLDALRSIVR